MKNCVSLPIIERLTANETFITASNVDIIGEDTDLTIPSATDVDWFSFTTRNLSSSPSEISISYDDQEVAQHLFPVLLSVLLPHREMGSGAAGQILSDIETTKEHLRLECLVVPRHSHMKGRN